MFQITRIHFSFLLFSLVYSLFSAGKALDMQQSHQWPHTLEPHEKESGDSMTKSTQWQNPAPVPLWAMTAFCTPFHLALVSILRLRSGVFVPLNLFLPYASVTIQKWGTRWKVWRWKSRRESLVPKQRWDAVENQTTTIGTGMSRKHNLLAARSHFAASSF